MKVGVFTFGSRGDVQPFLALAVGLRQAGHDAFLCAPSDFADLVAHHGVPFRPLSLNFKELQSRRAHTQLLRNRFTGVLRARRDLRRLGDAINRDAWRLLEDAEAIIYAPLTSTAYGVARKLDVPSFEVSYVPLEPSRDLAPVIAGMGRSHGPLLNRLASEIGYRVVWRIFGCSANRLRRQLSLPPLPYFGPLAEYARLCQPIFYLFSSAVVPRAGDWRKDIHVVGFTYLDTATDWQPPAELVRFLEAGPRPIFIGFGSMPNLKPAETSAMLIHAVERSGQRAILQSGDARLGEGATPGDKIFLAGDIPHSWLFTRVAAVMHHGGAGTTGAAFRAGVPQIVVPHMLDQPFWAERAYALGVSPRPFAARELSVDRVAAAITAVTTNHSLRQRAEEIAGKIRAEDGIARSVQLFEQYVARFRPGRSDTPSHESCNSGS